MHALGQAPQAKANTLPPTAAPRRRRRRSASPPSVRLWPAPPSAPGGLRGSGAPARRRRSRCASSGAAWRVARRRRGGEAPPPTRALSGALGPQRAGLQQQLPRLAKSRPCWMPRMVRERWRTHARACVPLTQRARVRAAARDALVNSRPRWRQRLLQRAGRRSIAPPRVCRLPRRRWSGAAAWQRRRSRGCSRAPGACCTCTARRRRRAARVPTPTRCARGCSCSSLDDARCAQHRPSRAAAGADGALCQRRRRRRACCTQAARRV
jgi:hypothetical protein